MVYINFERTYNVKDLTLVKKFEFLVADLRIHLERLVCISMYYSIQCRFSIRNNAVLGPDEYVGKTYQEVLGEADWNTELVDRFQDAILHGRYRVYSPAIVRNDNKPIV